MTVIYIISLGIGLMMVSSDIYQRDKLDLYLDMISEPGDNDAHKYFCAFYGMVGFGLFGIINKSLLPATMNFIAAIIAGCIFGFALGKASGHLD